MRIIRNLDLIGWVLAAVVFYGAVAVAIVGAFLGS